MSAGMEERGHRAIVDPVVLATPSTRTW